MRCIGLSDPVGTLGNIGDRLYISGMVEQISDRADELALLYDGECPVCSAYSAAVSVDGAAESAIRRVNARSDDPLVRQAVAAGLDLDDGMVVVHEGRLHHGADALHLMATLAPRTGFKNRVNRLMFGSRTVARLSYPLLRLGRNTLLRLLGRGKINRPAT